MSMTYAEIAFRRAELFAQLEEEDEEEDEEDGLAAPELPEHLQATIVTHHRIVTSFQGTMYQRCGGGRRVVRKRIGGS